MSQINRNKEILEQNSDFSLVNPNLCNADLLYSGMPLLTHRKSLTITAQIVEERKDKVLYKRDKKGDYPSFCV